MSPGVYAFKCRRAEKLFNLLQVRVREQGQPGQQGISLSTTQPLLSADQEETPGSPQGSVTVSRSVPPGFPGSVVNTGLIVQDRGDTGDYINCNITTTPSTPSYLNITQELPNTSQDPRHEYENIGPDLLQSPDYLPVRMVPPRPVSLQPSVEEDSQSVSQLSPPINSINYIVLDLETNNTNNTEDTAHHTAGEHNQGAGAGPGRLTDTLISPPLYLSSQLQIQRLEAEATSP